MFRAFRGRGPLRIGPPPGLSPRGGRIHRFGATPFLNVHQVERYELANGLKVLLVRDPAAPVVAFQTWYRVGARHEREGITGIAHLFEHLMFKETTTLPEGAFSKILEEAGARDLNAWTWYDETVYTQSVPKQYLELVMKLESDRMENLILNERQLAAEREVVINERRFRSEDDPYGRISEALSVLAFDLHPYRWPVIGWRRDIEAITLEDCLQFYRSYYAPNNATLILAGDLDSEETLELIDRHYGSLEAQPIQWPSIPVEPEQAEMRRRELTLPVEAEILSMGMKIPDLRHPDRAALQVLDVVLFHGKSSRLERKLIDTGIASSISSMLPPFVDPTLYEIQANLREGRTAEEAEQVIFEELEALAREGITRQELERALRKVRVGTYQELRDNGSRANFLGIYEVAAGGFEHGLRFLEEVERVSLEEVQRVAAAWLRPEQSTLIVARPAVAAPHPVESAHEVAHPEEVPDTTELEEELEELEEEVDQLMGEGEEEAPPAGLAHHPPVVPETPWKVQTFPMPRGSSLFVIEDRSVPLVSIQLLLPGGMALEPLEQEGITGFMGEMLLRGTIDSSREVFEEALDDLGADLSISADADHLFITASALAENWVELTDLLRKALIEPAFSEVEIERLRGEALAAVQEARNDDKSLVDHWFSRLLFPDHPYGRSALGTTSSLTAFTREDVVSAWKRAVHGSGVLMGVAGAISPEQAVETARALLSVLPEGGAVAVPPPGKASPGFRVVLVDKPERTQTQIMVGHPGAKISMPDYPLIQLGTMAFGGSAFTTRLMQEVREKRGWSYGAYARFDWHRDGSGFSIWVFPAMGDAATCLELVMELYRTVEREGITEAELDYARRAILNGAAFDEDTPERCLRGVIGRTWLGVDRPEVLRVIAEAELPAVNEALRRHYRPGDLLVTLVCTASQIEPKLRSLEGVSRIEVIAYDSE